MRIARFTSDDKTPRYAFVQQDKDDKKDYLVVLSGYPLSGQEIEPTGERIALDSDGVRLLAPIIPSKIYGLAVNYQQHADWFSHGELPKYMTVFMKPSTSVVGPDDPVVYPKWSQNLNYEPELAVVIGNIARNVPEADALKYVLGYTCVNDITARDVQAEDPTWTRAKGADTFCPLGPWVETDIDPTDAHIHFSLNGKDVPDAASTTANLIHSVAEQISQISQFATLLPGDVIMTGTPYASGSLEPGDETVVTIDGLGSLRNVVVAE